MSLEEKQLILAKVETTYGSDPTPTVSANALLTGKVNIEIVDASRERKVMLPYFGSLQKIPLGEGVKISFSVEVRGSGTATTPPRVAALLRAANLTETIGASYVDYDPNSSTDGESCTIYFYQDGILWKVLGCMTESIKLSAKANEIATLEFSLLGLWGGKASITDTSFPSPTYEATSIKPPIFNSATFTVHSYAGIISNFEVTIKNKIAKRLSANATNGILRYSIVGREVEGSIDPELVALSSFNPFDLWEDGDAGTITATIGSSAGNKYVITLSDTVIAPPKLGGREGMATYALSFTAHPTLSAGNGEIKIRHS